MNAKRVSDIDNTRIYFRADRVSLINGQYFFATREGTLEGPYKNKADACAAIERYIQRMTAPKPSWASNDGNFRLSIGD